MIVIRGYVLKSNDIIKIETILRDLRNKCKKKMKKEYTNLLREEIENLFDDISLNKMPRPDGNIFEIAKQILDDKIKNASLKQLPVEYNFNISVNILIDSDNITYFKVNSNNFIYDDAFKSIGDLNEYSLDMNESVSADNSKTIVWNRLMNFYSSNDNAPLSVNLIAGFEDVDVDMEKLSFTEPKKRAKTLARQEMTTRLINMYANGGQIPPHKLMTYIDMALSRLSYNQTIIDEMDNIYKELVKILQPIEYIPSEK